MIKEAIEYIRSTALQYREAKYLKRPGDPDQVVHLVDGTGVVMRQEVEPPNADHIVERLADLVAYANARKGENTTLFVNESVCVLVIDHATGWNQVALPLTETREHEWFEQRIAAPCQSVRDLRQALLYTVSACFDNARLVEQVSRLSALNQTTATAEATRTRESLGRSITDTIANEAELPNPSQVFSVRRWRNADLDHRVLLEARLDPDPANARWHLQPIEASWDAYRAAHLDHLEELIRAKLDKSIQVYRGKFITEP